MKTMGLNLKMVLLFTALLVLSGVIVTGLIGSDDKKVKAKNTVNSTLSTDADANQSEPEKKTEISSSRSDENISDEVPAEVAVDAVSSRVKVFEPEFDDAWCKAHCPGYTGKNISLSSEDIVIIDKKGSKITDYNELSLKLAPGISSARRTDLEKDYHFEDAYINVKGIGPMKIKAIKFSYEIIPPQGR